jgi:hypothetical protein
MRWERTGRASEIREVLDIHRCRGCQGVLASPHVTFGYLGCPCAGTDGHRTVFCLDCRTFNYDPPHDEEVRNVVGGASYFGTAGGASDQVR